MLKLLLLPFAVVFSLLVGLAGLIALPLFLLWLPFAILKLAFRAAFALLLLPFIVIAAVVVAGIALVLAILTPLIPLLIVGFIIWAILRLAARPVPV
jgi:hypothetical protein